MSANASGILADEIASLQSDPEYVAEGVALEFLEAVLDAMERRRMSKADLARSMNITRSAVTQIFRRSSNNLSLLTMARVAVAVGCEIACGLIPSGAELPPSQFHSIFNVPATSLSRLDSNGADSQSSQFASAA